LIEDIPSTPEPPVVSDTSKDSVFLTWDKSNNNKEDHITGYYIEKKFTDSDIWVRVNPTAPIIAKSLCISNLAVDRQYEFRLVAVNKAGESKSSESSTPVTIRDTTGNLLLH